MPSSDSVPRERSRRSSSSHRRRLEQDHHGVGDALTDPASALDVDLEQHVAAGFAVQLDRACGRAVPMPVEDLGPLQQLAVGDHAIEARVVDEEVVGAVDLPGSRRGAWSR